MNQEIVQSTSQPNPAELGGLAPDQQQLAVELRQDVFDKERHMLQTPSGNTVTTVWEGDIRHGVRHLGLKSAERAAKRHYKQNEGAYQEQALKEATDAGVDVTWEYGGKVPKDPRSLRLGNVALAAADAALAVDFAHTLAPSGATGDLIAGYLAYRFGKGAAVRGKAAIKGTGDTEMALAHHVVGRPFSAHGTKDDLRRERLKEARDKVDRQRRYA
jgi:hypothetical protein